MKISEAMSRKLLNVCDKEKISINKLATNCCLTQSTVQNIIECHSANPKLLTIVRICDGLNISLKDFFDDALFSEIDRED